MPGILAPAIDKELAAVAIVAGEAIVAVAEPRQDRTLIGEQIVAIVHQ